MTKQYYYKRHIKSINTVMIYPKDNTVVDAYPSTNFKDHFVIIGYEIARNGRPQSFYKDSLFEIPPSITAEIEECLTREFQEV